MPSRWYRSLYWRIAIGFVVCLAAMLVLQAVLFVWVASRSGPTMPGQPPDRFAETVALDVAATLERDPGTDLHEYIGEQYGRDAHPVIVLMADGRMIQNVVVPVPDPLLRQARLLLERRGGEPFRRGPGPDGRRPGPEWRDPGPDGGGPRPEWRGRGARRDSPDWLLERGRGFGRGGPGFGPMRPAPIVVNGELAGVVVVPPRAPFRFLLQRYAWTLSLVGGGALVVGTLLAALVIFGPARRRLREVEDAARRLGSGDLSARAPERGGDEVAAVASAFNAMATDLAARAGALAASDRARRQLLADISHELTTPVTAMRGYLETLTMPEFAVDQPTTARYLGIIGDETARLERIIGDLLDLARVEGGGAAFTVEDIAVEQLFARVVARHERACTAAGITMTTRIDQGAAVAHGDPNRLEQALQNLAANAVRYAPRGTAIELAARREDGSIAFSVADQGPGIAPEHLPHLFDRFYKADASRGGAVTGSGGSGLGLSIVKAIVERHGGGISVSSQPGRTVFEFRISLIPNS